MVRESNKQSRTKARQMSNEKAVGGGGGWKEKAWEVGISSFFVSPLSSVPSFSRLSTYLTKNEQNHSEKSACHAG